MKNFFTVTLNPLAILAPRFHAGGTGFWDEVLAIVGTILFIGILIHMYFFDNPLAKPSHSKDNKMDDDDKHKNS